MADKKMLKLFCFITGSSQGLGEAIAIRFAARSAKGSVLFLHGRNAKLLQDVKDKISKDNQNVNIKIIQADLAEEEGYRKVTEAFSDAAGEHFDKAVLVHNATTLMDTHKTKASEQNNGEKLDAFFRMQLTSTCIITSEFIKVFRASKSNPYIIDITSESVNNRRIGTALYAATKSAREKYFGVVALEDPDVRILSYEPGIMVTSFTSGLLAELHDRKLAAELISAMEKNEGHWVITPSESAERLVNIFDKDAWENGTIMQWSGTVE